MSSFIRTIGLCLALGLMACGPSSEELEAEAARKELQATTAARNFQKTYEATNEIAGNPDITVAVRRLGGIHETVFVEVESTAWTAMNDINRRKYIDSLQTSWAKAYVDKFGEDDGAPNLYVVDNTDDRLGGWTVSRGAWVEE